MWQNDKTTKKSRHHQNWRAKENQVQLEVKLRLEQQVESEHKRTGFRTSPTTGFVLAGVQSGGRVQWICSWLLPTGEGFFFFAHCCPLLLWRSRLCQAIRDAIGCDVALGKKLQLINWNLVIFFILGFNSIDVDVSPERTTHHSQVVSPPAAATWCYSGETAEHHCIILLWAQNQLKLVGCKQRAQSGRSLMSSTGDLTSSKMIFFFKLKFLETQRISKFLF